MTLARISITIPRPLVAAADRRAKQLHRSRSWVVSDALRQYLAGPPGLGYPEERGRTVREATPQLYAAGEVAAARRRHLAAELALAPSERLRRAEELGHLASEAQRRGRRHQIIGFDSYEDYYEWKKARLIGA